MQFTEAKIESGSWYWTIERDTLKFGMGIKWNYDYFLLCISFP
jgi:hypothetical protein